jgi:hypothetical protein
MGLCSYCNGEILGHQSAVASMASSVRRLLTSAEFRADEGNLQTPIAFDYDWALNKFGALAFVASDSHLSELALANIRPAVAALFSRSSGGISNASLMLLLKWGQGSKNRHFVDVHCHASALPPSNDVAVTSSVSLDAFVIPLPSHISARSSGMGGYKGRSDIRLSWLDAGVDLS